MAIYSTIESIINTASDESDMHLIQQAIRIERKENKAELNGNYITADEYAAREARLDALELKACEVKF